MKKLITCFSAVLDVNGTTVSSDDIRVHLLQKLTNSSTDSSIDMLDRTIENEEDDVYLIPRSSAPVRDCYYWDCFRHFFLMDVVYLMMTHDQFAYHWLNTFVIYLHMRITDLKNIIHSCLFYSI